MPGDCPFCDRIAADGYGPAMLGQPSRGLRSFRHNARFVINNHGENVVKRGNQAAYTTERRAVAVLAADPVSDNRRRYPARACRCGYQSPLAGVVGTAQRPVSILGVQARIEQTAGTGVSRQHRTRELGAQCRLNAATTCLIRQRAWLATDRPARASVNGTVPGAYAPAGAAARVAVSAPAGTPGSHLVAAGLAAASGQPKHRSLKAGPARLPTHWAARSRLARDPGHAIQTTVQHRLTLSLTSELHIHVVPRREGDGLRLPWTGQEVAGKEGTDG